MTDNVPKLKKKKSFNSNFFRKYIYVFVLGVVLLFGVSYGLTFFVQNKEVTDGLITVGDASFNSLPASINLSNLEAKTDSEGISLNPLTLTINNTSNYNGKAKIFIERTSGIGLEDLRYGLFVNGVLRKIDNVPSNGILDEFVVLSGESNLVEVRLWVDEDYAGAETTFVGSLSASLERDAIYASSYLGTLANLNNNYVYFNCSNTCEVWRIKGIEDGRLILTTNAYLSNTFTNSNLFTNPSGLNDERMVFSMSTDNHAVYLKKTVKIVDGEGTSANPFTLENSLESISDEKVIAVLTYNDNGVTTTQNIYYGRTNYISKVGAGIPFYGWTDGVNTYQLGDIVTFTTNTTLMPVVLAKQISHSGYRPNALGCNLPGLDGNVQCVLDQINDLLG